MLLVTACDPQCSNTSGCNTLGGGNCDTLCNKGYGLTPANKCLRKFVQMCILWISVCELASLKLTVIINYFLLVFTMPNGINFFGERFFPNTVSSVVEQYSSFWELSCTNGRKPCV